MSRFGVFCFTSPVFKGLKERTPNASSASSGNHQHIFFLELHTCEVSCRQFVWEMMFCFPHLFICDVYWGGDIPWWRKILDGLLTRFWPIRSLGRGGSIWTESLMNTRQARQTHLAPWVKHGTYSYLWWIARNFNMAAVFSFGKLIF